MHTVLIVHFIIKFFRTTREFLEIWSYKVEINQKRIMAMVWAICIFMLSDLDIVLQAMIKIFLVYYPKNPTLKYVFDVLLLSGVISLLVCYLIGVFIVQMIKYLVQQPSLIRKNQRDDKPSSFVNNEVTIYNCSINEFESIQEVENQKYWDLDSLNGD